MSETQPIPTDLRWHTALTAQSIRTSALALAVFAAADFLDLGHLKTWHVYTILPLYFVGLVMAYRIHRRQHRKQRALLPLDPSGNARYALVLAAFPLSWASANDPATDGIGPRLAIGALILGAVTDGAWLAILAIPRRQGIWRTCRELARREHEARQHCWDVLIGTDDPKAAERPGERSISTARPPHPDGRPPTPPRKGAER